MSSDFINTRALKIEALQICFPLYFFFFLVAFKETNNSNNAENIDITVSNTILAKINRNQLINFKPVQSKLLHFISMIFFYSILSHTYLKTFFNLHTLYHALLCNYYLILSPGVNVKLLLSSAQVQFCCSTGNLFLPLLVKATGFAMTWQCLKKDRRTQGDIYKEDLYTDSKKL